MSKAFQLKLREIQTRIPKVVRRLPGVVKVEGLRFIADNFKNQGFETKKGQYKKWKKKDKKGSRKNTLVGEKRGGSLKRSWKKESTASGTQVEFTSSLPYAEVHNEGLQAGRPPGFTMEQRQMIGDSEALNDRIENKLDRMVADIYK
jgi:phage gpG-like protein